jgi:hypothetical protein
MWWRKGGDCGGGGGGHGGGCGGGVCECGGGGFLFLMYILMFVLTVFNRTLSRLAKCPTVTFRV